MPCLDDELASGFVAGSLAPALRHQVASHVDSCPACRELVAELAREVGDDNGRAGDAADRYVLGDPIGRGAMGQVVRAHDRRLHREVAIKITRRDRPEDELRFQREAQALARLNHPNVVAVYDVFDADGATCIAMEIVPGVALAEWAAQRQEARVGRRGWRAVCDLMAQVGRGLAAVHRAGLVHRDVKPSNILVTDERVAKLADFGLVRRRGATDGGGSPPADPVAYDLTVTGAAVGTLGYMAPEVLEGGEATVQSDQYSFCVAFYELLVGRRPFDRDSADALRSAIAAGLPLERAVRRRLPRRLIALLRRGLSADPAKRFDDMDALLRALPRTSAPIGRVAVATAAGAGLAAALVVVAAAAMGLGGDADGDACGRGESAIDAVWSGAPRSAVARAFAASGSPDAAELEPTVLAALDRYAADWRGMHRASCAASERGEQSVQHLDRRMQCLIRARVAMAATVDLLARADRAIVESAPDAVAALPPVADCGDFVRLDQVVALPPQPAVRRAVEQIEIDLARVKALSDTGQLDRASDLVGPIVARARTAGYSPLLARALLAAGQAAAGRQPAVAESSLREATRIAATAGDSTTEARAWIDLIDVVGSQQGRTREALAFEYPASVAVGRVGSKVPAGALYLTLGMVHNVDGDPDRAIERYRQALPFAEGDPARLAAVHNDLGNAYRASGRDELALEHLRLALEQYDRSPHPNRVRIAIVLLNQSSILRRRGDLPAALAALERARGIIESRAAAEGAVWLQLAEQLAAASAALGHTDEAERWYREALATARRVHGERHIATAYQAENYGMFLAGHGRASEASELLDLSIAIQAEAHGADSEKLAMSYANRGTFRYEQRDLTGAIDDLSRAARLGGDRPEGIYAAVQLGTALHRTGRRREALPSLTDGIARAERAGQDQVAHIAAARLEAATLVWSTSRARARDQAAAALATYRHLGDQAGATEAEAWFRHRGAVAPR